MSERENRTIVECTRTMLHAKNLPLNFWAGAVNTAVCTLNHTESCKDPGITPREIWMGEKPSHGHMRSFSSEAFLHIDDKLRKRLSPKWIRVLLFGNQTNFSNYSFKIFNYIIIKK